MNTAAVIDTYGIKLTNINEYARHVMARVATPKGYGPGLVPRTAIMRVGRLLTTREELSPGRARCRACQQAAVDRKFCAGHIGHLVGRQHHR